MDTTAFVQLISNIGFPIACVVAMFYYWNKEREDHRHEMDAMTEAVNNNSKVLVELKTLITTIKTISNINKEV